jgi:hypothetical protein
MATFKLANASLGVLAAALIADLDSAASPAYIEVYDGTQAATPGTAITSQVKLGTATMSADPSATNSAGLITFNAIAQDNAADASGTATWLRIFKGDATVWADADVGNLASSATAKMNTTTIVSGGPIRVNAFTIQVG